MFARSVWSCRQDDFRTFLRKGAFRDNSFSTSSVASNAALSLVTGKTFKLLELPLLNVHRDICYDTNVLQRNGKNERSSFRAHPLSTSIKTQITMQRNFKDVKDVKHGRSAYNMLFQSTFVVCRMTATSTMQSTCNRITNQSANQNVHGATKFQYIQVI